MRVLFDHSTPAPLRHHRPGHEVQEAIDQGWDRLTNGELLAAAEREGFDVLITADKNIRYRLHAEKVVAALDDATPGSYMQVDIPWKTNSRV